MSAIDRVEVLASFGHAVRIVLCGTDLFVQVKDQPWHDIGVFSEFEETAYTKAKALALEAKARIDEYDRIVELVEA